MTEEIEELSEYELMQARAARKLENTARILASKKLRQLRRVENVDNSQTVQAALKKVQDEGGRVLLVGQNKKGKTYNAVTPLMLTVLETEIERLEKKIAPLKEALQKGESKNKERDKDNIKFLLKQLNPRKEELKKLKAVLKEQEASGNKNNANPGREQTTNQPLLTLNNTNNKNDK
jgi:hypothetical protein